MLYTYYLRRDPEKEYKLACEQIKDSAQTAHPRSLIRVFDGRSMCSQGFQIDQAENNASNQTVWMRRLI